MKYLTLLIVLGLFSNIQAQDFEKHRLTNLELSGGVVGFQDARFFNQVFKGPKINLTLSSSLEKANHIRGFGLGYGIGIMENSIVDEGGFLSNLDLNYEYLVKVSDHVAFGAKWDIFNLQVHKVSSLPNTGSGVDINSTILPKIMYNSNNSNGWNFKASVAVGLFGFRRSSISPTFGSAPISIIKDEKFDLYNYQEDSILSLQNFSFYTLGKLNKFEINAEVYKNSWDFFYRNRLYNVKEVKDAPFTIFSK